VSSRVARVSRARHAGSQVCAIVAVLLVGSAACRSSTRSSQEQGGGPVRGGTLVASIRSEPRTFNRYVDNSGVADATTALTQAKLVRINRQTEELEPWLAERWTTSPDGRSFTLTLRPGVSFSDGTPFTSADVLFSFAAVYDPKLQSNLSSGMKVQGKPLQVTAPDPATVVITLPAPFTPGLRLLDNLPILPKHQLEAALKAGTFADAWGVANGPGHMAGLGPFVVSEYVPGQHVTLTRNPRYWRKDASGGQLPYLDGVVLEIASGQDAEIQRLESGSIDLMTQADMRPQDYATVRRLRDRGALRLIDVGTGLDPNILWFNLAKTPPGRAYLQKAEFRQAVSYAVDREAIVNSVYLGAAVPVYGPVTPGNRVWFSDAAPKYPHDLARAKSLLGGIGLTDRNGDGMLEDAAGAPVRFSILTQGGNIRAQTATVIQEHLRQAGIAVDIVPLDFPSIAQRWMSHDYDSIYYGFQASAMDPAMNLDFWLSSGSVHVWDPEQAAPATPWERRIDELMQQQIAAPTLEERRQLFAEVQKIFGENLPGIYFIAPKVSIATSPRVAGAEPALLDPKVLWNSDTLNVTDGASAPHR
jgi:peptide/nickel transport system substrate-binding protein